MSQIYKSADGIRSQAMKLDPELVTVVSAWCKARIVEEIDPFDDMKRQPGLNVKCKNGLQRASLGDYVVKNLEDDTFEVFHPNAFAHSYSPWEG